MMKMKKVVMMIPGPPSRLKLEVASYDRDEEKEKRKRMIDHDDDDNVDGDNDDHTDDDDDYMTSFKAREYHSSKHEVASHYERDAHCAETKHRTLPVSKIYISTILQESY